MSRGSISERALATLLGTRHDRGVFLDELKQLPNEAAQMAAVTRALADDRAVMAAAKEIRAESQRLRHVVRLAHMEIVADNGRASAPTALGRLDAVYFADPPWKFGVRSEETGREKSAENHYPTLTTDEIVDLLAGLIGPVDGKANPAVLSLWVTNPMLLDGIRVLQACGFTYVHNWIWDKESAGTGYWGRDRHEHLLIGRRGEIAAPLPGSQPETVHRERKGRHSEKPDFYARTIERLFPGIARLELFARGPRPGWDVWGSRPGRLPPSILPRRRRGREPPGHKLGNPAARHLACREACPLAFMRSTQS